MLLHLVNVSYVTGYVHASSRLDLCMDGASLDPRLLFVRKEPGVEARTEYICILCMDGVHIISHLSLLHARPRSVMKRTTALTDFLMFLRKQTDNSLRYLCILSYLGVA